MKHKIRIHEKLVGSEKFHGAIIFAQYNGKWVLCRQKSKDTWEVPGGRLNFAGETLLDCAKRELIEETGAVCFDINHVGYYSNEIENEERTLGVFYANIKSVAKLQENEIAETRIFRTFPENVSYPELYELLLPTITKSEEKIKRNIYQNPTKYLKELQNSFVTPTQVRHEGKSFIAAFFTKICKAGCNSCFFRSNSKMNAEFLEKQEMTNDGFEKFLRFVNQSNNGYLLLSGGGEPFEKVEYIIETIKRAKTDKIVIATSGYWANNMDKAEKILDALAVAKMQRKDNLDFILRVSADEFHADKIGTHGVENIITLFEEKFLNYSNFRLQIHTLHNDKTVANLINQMNGQRVDFADKVVDANKNKNSYIMQTREGLQIQVEEAKLFHSNLKVNLQNLSNPELDVALEVFFNDVRISQNGNFSIIKNADGTKGLDYLINYNGNVTTWGTTKEIIHLIFMSILQMR